MKNKTVEKKLETELKNKTVLITGGAGSVGTVLTKKVLQFPVSQVRIIDVDEHALFKLKRSISDDRIRLLLGNITDKERIEMAGKNIDIVIHAAAVKNVEISEYNPIETIDVNINGTINMIKMAMKNAPKKFLNISTDKSVNSSTIYGATKLISERITTWAGIHLNPPTKFASVRFGNVIESRGNVFEVWNHEVAKKQPLSITHPDMRRFFFHVDEAVDFILSCLPLVDQGEVFVPKMKLYKIKDLAEQISKNQKIIGIRRGEKMDEVMITDDERNYAIEKDNMWIIKSRI